MQERNQQPEILMNLQDIINEPGGRTMQEWLETALQTDIPVHDIRNAMIQGMERVRHRFMSSDFGLPDFLICIDTVLEGLSRISDIEKDGAAPGIPIVIGVVEGDPHDLGKNVIAGIYRAYGYRVIDLGRDVSCEVFVKSVVESRARVLALSAMMSTTMVKMRDIIREVKFTCPATQVIVGGAPLNEVLAQSYGADCYIETALTVIEETRASLDMCR